MGEFQYLTINGTTYAVVGSGSGSSVTFIPSVSQEGVLSWTNESGLENPDPVTIMGPQGAAGPRGSSVLVITSTPAAYTSAVNGLTPAHRVLLSSVKTQANVTEVFPGDILLSGTYYYPVIYVDGTYAYCSARVNIRGADGEPGADGLDGVGISHLEYFPTEEDGAANILCIDMNGTASEYHIYNGKTGTAGKTPVKGTDYWTDADKAGIMQDLQAEMGIETTPDYVRTAAEAVADKILAVRNADTFVMACVSDLHTSGSDAYVTGILHAGQAMCQMQSLTELDLVAMLGDIPVGDFEEDSFKYVKKCFADIAKRVPYMHLQGNHDESPSDTTEVARQRYYAYIGANNVGTVTDYANKFRNYGYRDFDNYKVRVIYLNTADVSENEMTYDNNITAAQMAWFAGTALNLSEKEDAAHWGVIVCGHHPLNWAASGNGSVTKVLDVLDAYKGRTSGSVTVDGQSIAYDFSGETAEFICHIHGHLHNFREEVLGTNKVLSITVPNACFGRNNEYGNYDYATYPEVVERYGDDGANNDGTGTQRTYTKTSETAEDTAFSVFCIDRASKTVHVFNYGAGIDRVWDYASGIKGEGSGEPDTPVVPEEPDEPTPSYTNRIPLSVNGDESEYVGHNGEDGYSVGYRVRSNGAEEQCSGMCCTGYIPCTMGQTIRLKNVTIAGTKDAYLVEYYGSKAYKQVTALATSLTDDGSGVYVGEVPDCAYIRITCGVIDDTSILTLDEEIV